MKCKNWSNKLNNFVVRKLKSFKINGQQQSLSSTMPAMPNEKTTPISLDESNFDEIKMKEHQLDTSSTSSSSNTSVKLIKCNNISQNNRKICNSSNNINNTSNNSSYCCNYDENCCNGICNLSLNGLSTTITATSSSSSSSPPSTSMSSSTQQTAISNRINLCKNINNSNNYCNNSNQYVISATTSSSSSSASTATITPISYKSRNTLNNVIKSTTTTTQDCCNSTKLANNLLNYNNSTITTTSTTTTATPQSTTTVTNNRLNSSNCHTNQNDTNIKLQQQNMENVTRKINGMVINNSTPTTSTSSSSNNTAAAAAAQQQQNRQNSRLTNVPIKKSVNDFIFGKYIGEGSFSTVYLASDIHTKKEYAIKVCEKHHIIREKKQEYIKREREVMHLVSSVPGFVNLYCTFQDDSRLYFAMTHAKNGDLLPYINKVGSFDIECTQHYAAELVLACENMHKLGIIHRDLKPENILLDENMHTLIADFGSAKIIDQNSQNLNILLNTTASSSVASSSPPKMTTTTTTTTVPTPPSGAERIRNRRLYNQQYQRSSDSCDGDSDDINNDTTTNQPPRRRKCSFVGTAQYVTPEVLQNGPITRSVDLWALGCIIYQMISGLPPFRGTNDYFIFREILGLNLIFPDGFDKNGEDLVRKLLKINPIERLGALDTTDIYHSIREHPFFNGIDWDRIRQRTPPPIYPYLPGVNKDEELRSQYRVPDNLEPGLDNMKLTRLLGLSLLGFEAGNNKTEPEGGDHNDLLLTDEINNQQKNNIEAQKLDNWDAFADGELILKKGFINKRKGLFARKRMLLLTTGPRLIYIDPVQMVKKGEIPWSSELRVEPKNFKIFFVHTPNRTYYLEDPEGYALNWVDAIENIRKSTYNQST